MNEGDRVIPLDVAHQFLSTFGATEPTPLYDRRIRPDGFKLSDLHELIGEQRFVFAMDWRGFLDDCVPDIVAALAELGTEILFQVDDDGHTGTLRDGGGRVESIGYAPDGGMSFNSVVEAFRRLVPGDIEFRQSPANDGSDGWEYAVLSAGEWAELEALDPAAVRWMFVPFT